jgi:hypothetical protein
MAEEISLTLLHKKDAEVNTGPFKIDIYKRKQL